MPYIIPHSRKLLDDRIRKPASPGELAYLVYKLCKEYAWGSSFADMNAVVGVLENCKHEFQRRVLDPYEDKKRENNGDV